MTSIVDDLLEKIRRDPGVTKRGGARADLGMMLFAEREAINALWKAAAACRGASEELDTAVEKLKPLFGER